MKKTDFAPRPAFFDTFIMPDMEILEVGCDVGSHAAAMLSYCHIKNLTVIDIWENDLCQGYCMGRLTPWFNMVTFIKATSHEVAFNNEKWFDGIYLDITHDYDTVKESLSDWWGAIREKGILGYRNYSESNPGLWKAVNEFVKEHKIRTTYSSYDNEIVLFK